MVRWDSAGGDSLLNSGVIVDDSNNVSSLTIDAAKFIGTITGAGTISGGTITSATITLSIINTATINTPTIDAAKLTGTVTNAGTISGGTFTGGTLNSGIIAATCTLAGTISGGTVNIATLQACTVVSGIAVHSTTTTLGQIVSVCYTTSAITSTTGYAEGTVQFIYTA